MLLSPVVFSVAAGLCALDAGAQRATRAPVVRDSGNVRIVEHARLAVVRALTVEARPWLRLGGLREIEAEEFSTKAMQLNPVVLSDGRIAVTDLAHIKLFDRDGKFLRTFGRPGPGPGEFTQIGSLCRFGGDSLLAYDYQDGRLSVWTSDGAFVRAHKPVGNVSYMIPCYSDGSVVVQMPSGGRGAIVAPHVRMRTDGSTVGPLGDLPIESFLPVARYASIIPTVDRLYVATGESWEVRAYTHDGRLASILRVDEPRIPMSDAYLRDQLNQRFPAGMMSDAQRNAQVERFMAMPRPSTVPAIGLVRIDARGSVWISGYEDFQHWTVFGKDGGVLGTVRLPDIDGQRTRLTGFTDDGIIIDHTDADGARVLSFHRIAELTSARD